MAQQDGVEMDLLPAPHQEQLVGPLHEQGATTAGPLLPLQKLEQVGEKLGPRLLEAALQPRQSLPLLLQPRLASPDALPVDLKQHPVDPSAGPLPLL